MSDAITLPGDLFVPEVALAAFQCEFVSSLAAMKFIGQGPGYPIQITGFDRLVSGGQFVTVPVVSRISNLETRRDVTSEALVNTLKFASRNDRGVLINRKIGPVSISKSAEDLSIMQPGQLENLFGTQAARVVMETIQSFAIRAAYGACAAVTTSAHTKSVWATDARTNLSTALLALIRAKMGDAASQIVAWVMRSEPYFIDLITAQLGAGVTGIADVVAAGGAPHTLGGGYAVVDEAILTAADSGYDKYYTVGLGEGAIKIEFTRPMEIYPPQVELRSENKQIIFRGDYDFALQVPGMAFSSGVANPTTTNIADSSNWTPTYGDHREVRIVLGEHNYSGN
jgi:hypothetical protein